MISNPASNELCDELDDKLGNKFKYKIYYCNQPHNLIRFWPKFIAELKKQKCKVVAFDTERDIIKSKRYPYDLARVRVLSICTGSVCFVISFSNKTPGYGVTAKAELDPKSRYILPEQISDILEDHGIIKIGISTDEEELYLKGTFVKVKKDQSDVNEAWPEIIIKNAYDLQNREKIISNLDHQPSLVDICSKYLGISVSKDEKLTEWGVDILTNDQIIYSALDSIFVYILRKT